jgi:hypothetical protein
VKTTRTCLSRASACQIVMILSISRHSNRCEKGVKPKQWVDYLMETIL